MRKTRLIASSYSKQMDEYKREKRRAYSRLYYKKNREKLLAEKEKIKVIKNEEENTK